MTWARARRGPDCLAEAVGVQQAGVYTTHAITCHHMSSRQGLGALELLSGLRVGTSSRIAIIFCCDPVAILFDKGEDEEAVCLHKR